MGMISREFRLATISKISAENFLSLQDVSLELQPLNVLVGPNGAGKTNILKLFQFIGEVARIDLSPAIEAMGEFENLLFRGVDRKTRTVSIRFEGIMSQHASTKAPDEYRLSFWQQNMARSSPGERRRLLNRVEEITIKRTAGRGRRISLRGGGLKVEKIGEKRGAAVPSSLRLQTGATGLATLRRLGEDYEASGVEAIAQIFEQLRLFEIDVERVRRPVRWSRTQALRSDAANLAPYLIFLQNEHPEIFELVCDDVRFVLPGFKGFEFRPIEGGEDAFTVDIVEEHLVGSTPLARASFGTIRAIALFAMLHDPAPPQLTCLEEIDHGLHPHALDRLVDRVREASKNTQIILATHSPALVNRLDPSELIIVERDEITGGTRVTRPDIEFVSSLQNETGYGLGELWFSGTIGGAL